MPKAINDNSSVTSTFVVGTPGRVKDVRVRIGQIRHSYVGDLRLELIAPDGTSVVLADRRGGSGDDMQNTTFAAAASSPIADASAPFTGTFRPEGDLHALDGRSQQGTWTLKVSDTRAPDTGQLESWGADVSSAVCSGAPVAALAASPNPALPGATVTLDGSGSVDPNGSIVRYQWDLDGDGVYETDTQGNSQTTTSFPTRGAKRVGLRVTDDAGDTRTEAITVSVTQPPTAAFTVAPGTPATGTPVTFDASGSGDPDGTIARYRWDLDGNGTFETDGGSDPTTSHSYAAPGSYTVHLEVTDDDGAKAVAAQDVDVTNRGPTASFTAPDPAEVGEPGLFDASASADPDGAVVGYRWDFDGDGSYEFDAGSDPTVLYTFTTPGTRTVRLEVSDADGGSALAQQAVRVTQPPLASLVVSPATITAGQSATFDATGSTDPDGSIVRYDWDLDGNGTYENTTGTSPQTTRSYPNRGTIPVSVRAVDDDGGRGTASASLVVVDPPPSGGPGTNGQGPGGPAAPASAAPTAGSGEAPAGAGTPSAVPGSGLGAGAPMRATLGGPVLQKARDVRRRGLALTCEADRPATCSVRAELAPAVARRLKLTGKRKRRKGGAPVVLGSAQSGSGGGLVVRVGGRAGRALARARSVPITVRGDAVDPGGARVALTRVVLVRR